MTVAFDSFCESRLGGFIESPLGERGCEVGCEPCPGMCSTWLWPCYAALRMPCTLSAPCGLTLDDSRCVTHRLWKTRIHDPSLNVVLQFVSCVSSGFRFIAKYRCPCSCTGGLELWFYFDPETDFIEGVSVVGMDFFCAKHLTSSFCWDRGGGGWDRWQVNGPGGEGPDDHMFFKPPHGSLIDDSVPPPLAFAVLAGNVLAGAGGCSASPSELSFGAVRVGESRDLSFYVIADGSISGGIVTSPCSEFTIVGSGAWRGGPPATRITVRYAPVDDGVDNCRLSLGHGSCDDLPVSGRGWSTFLHRVSFEEGLDFQFGQLRNARVDCGNEGTFGHLSASDGPATHCGSGTEDDPYRCRYIYGSAIGKAICAHPEWGIPEWAC